MRQLLVFLSIGLFVAACSGDQETEDKEKKFASVSTYVDNSYPPLDAFCKDIMEGLQICTQVDSNVTLPPCSAEYFRVFKHRPEKEWKVGFIIEMVAGLFNTPVRQIVIVEEQFGKYSIVNQYLGSLLELRTRENGYSDLLIGYDDPDIGRVTIRHEWQGEKYDPVDVEEINDHFVKPEAKDSINAIFLPAFNAGH